MTATCARLSDARIATAASLFIGVLFCSAPRPHISFTPPDSRWIRRRRDHDHAPGSACWETDHCDREKSIRSVPTGPDFLGVCLGLILTRVRAAPEEQDSYSRTARMQETGYPGLGRTAPTYMFTQHPQHTYIHRHTHAHTHIQATSEIHAHVYTAIVYYESFN